LQGRAIQYNGDVLAGNNRRRRRRQPHLGPPQRGPLGETYGVLAFDASYVSITDNGDDPA